MSAVLELIPRAFEEGVREDVSVETPREQQAVAKSGKWNLAAFADDQICGLVQQVFLSGRKRSRQVLFSAVDEEADIASLCLSVAQALVRQDSGNACVVEARPHPSVERPPGDDDVVPSNSEKRFGVLRDRAQQLSSRLWFMSRGVLLDGNDGKFSPLWLRSRLAELRLEFDFTVLQGPAAGVSREAALLGNLCDGLVLVIQANSTRRVAAQRAKQMLHAADARLLGTVLSNRSFPIPEALYKRL